MASFHLQAIDFYKTYRNLTLWDLFEIIQELKNWCWSTQIDNICVVKKAQKNIVIVLAMRKKNILYVKHTNIFQTS